MNHDRQSFFAHRGPQEIDQRIHALEREWDVERMLELNAAAVAFAGLALAVTHNRKWLWVPGVVLPFLFQHATQGWCPPLPVLRRLGLRTREEIDREKYALADACRANRRPFERRPGTREELDREKCAPADACRAKRSSQSTKAISATARQARRDRPSAVR